MICAGNWKMNMSPAQAEAFARQLVAEVPVTAKDKFVLLPPALLAGTLATELKGSGIAWGGQNCYCELKGAFTGENSPQLLAEMGAQYCLVGHSERRHVFGEPDELLAKKVAALQKVSVTPILCVGETLEDRRANRTQEVIEGQLGAGLRGADSSRPLWIAYEPVWAIGTGLVATPQQVEEAHSILRRVLVSWNAACSVTPILYGGSVKSDNVASLSSLNNVNGFLIGGASLDVREFLRIFQNSAIG